MMMTPTVQSAPLADGLRHLVGRQVSSVEFVQDYVQLKFDGPRISAFVLPVIDLHGKRLGHDSPGYRDALCTRIGRVVVLAEFRDGEGLSLSFDDGVAIEISVRDKDYTGPEALEFVDGPQRWVA